MDTETFFDSVTSWAALRTAARWEKAVAEQLRAVGVPAYLPLMTRVSRSRSKTQSAEVPVFPGYVFCGEAEFRGNPRVSPSCRQKVAQLLRAPDQDKLKAELRAIAGLLCDHQLVQERLYGSVGDTIRIVGGPLTGHTGQILRLKPGTRRIVLEVSFIGSSVEVTLDETLVEKLRTG